MPVRQINKQTKHDLYIPIYEKCIKCMYILTLFYFFNKKVYMSIDIGICLLLNSLRAKLEIYYG